MMCDLEINSGSEPEEQNSPKPASSPSCTEVAEEDPEAVQEARFQAFLVDPAYDYPDTLPNSPASSASSQVESPSPQTINILPEAATMSAEDSAHPPAPSIDRDPNGFVTFPHGHKDMVQAVAFNVYGDRLATGSVDGQVKVYNKNQDGLWVLQDTWAAHLSEVLEIQWLPPTIHPHVLGSVGIDGRFRLWAEDITIAPNSGRRFSSLRESQGCFFELRAPPRTPFLSMSMKHNSDTRRTYLALLNRDGLLKVWVNEEAEDLRNWTELDEVKVCNKPERGVETSFKVRFDPNLDPSYNAIAQGLSMDALGLAVASMNRATIWRTKEISHDSTLGLGGDATAKELYLAAELPGHRLLVRDIAWAPNSIRGFDIVATACKDGYLRVFEIHTPPKSSTESNAKENETGTAILPQKQGEAAPSRERNPPSGIGAGLAKGGAGGSQANKADGATGKGEGVFHLVKEVARLGDHRSAVWKVSFDADGQLLGSTGDDGKLWLWRRRPDGSWANSAQLGVDIPGANTAEVAGSSVS